MKYTIDKAILKKADKCPHNFTCQSNGGKPQCTISESVGGTVLFTTSRPPAGCRYQCSFGSAFICSCPVRREIFRKHRS